MLATVAVYMSYMKTAKSRVMPRIRTHVVDIKYISFLLKI